MADDVEMANDEGADPTRDIQKQNPGASTTGDETGMDSPGETKTDGSDGKPGGASG